MRRQSGMFIPPSAGHFSTGGEYTKKKGYTMEFKRGDRVRTLDGSQGEYIGLGALSGAPYIVDDEGFVIQCDTCVTPILTDEEIASKVAEQMFGYWSSDEHKNRQLVARCIEGIASYSRLRDERDGR